MWHPLMVSTYMYIKKFELLKSEYFVVKLNCYFFQLYTDIGIVCNSLRIITCCLNLQALLFCIFLFKVFFMKVDNDG